MKLSIIVPVYNTNIDDLSKCFDSIFDNFDNDFELLIVDASNNKTTINFLKSIVKSKSAHNIKLLTTTKGVSHQRNVGIDSSQGEYITFIDSDDILCANYFKLLFKSLSANNYDVVSPILVRRKYLNDGSYTDTKMACSFNDNKITKDNYFVSSLTNGLVHPIKIYNRKLIDKIRFDEKLSHGEDMMFNYELSKKRFTFSYVNDCFYFYTTKEGNNSANKRLSFKSMRIISRIYNVYTKNKKITNKENADGMYDEFSFLFKTYFDVCAKRIKVIYLISLLKYRFIYLKRCKNKKERLYILFPILTTFYRKIKK